MGRHRNKKLDFCPVVVKLSLPVNEKLEAIQKTEREDYNRKVTKPVLINELLEEKLLKK